MQFSQKTDKMVWYSHLSKSFPQFVMIYIVKGFSVVDETEIDVFLKFSCFFYNPANVGNLISVSFSSSKPSLDTWKFLVCIMLKPNIQDFKHDLTSKMSSIVQCTFSHSLAVPYLGIGMRIDIFQSCDHCWVFQVCWHTECKTLMTFSFRFLSSSTGIPSHPLALLTAVLPKAHLTSLSRMSGSWWLTTPS